MGGSDTIPMTLEPRQRFFEHDGLKLSYWEWGDPREETYVFVHGVRDQGRSWDHFLEALLRRGVYKTARDKFEYQRPDVVQHAFEVVQAPLRIRVYAMLSSLLSVMITRPPRSA